MSKKLEPDLLAEIMTQVLSNQHYLLCETEMIKKLLITPQCNRDVYSVNMSSIIGDVRKDDAEKLVARIQKLMKE